MSAVLLLFAEDCGIMQQVQTSAMGKLLEVFDMDKKKWIFVAVGALVILVIVLAVIFCIPGEKKEISLRDYVSITEEGIDGYGSITVEAKTSEDADVQALLQTMKIKHQLQEGKFNGFLSNGDVVSVTVEYDEKKAEELGFSVQNATFEYTMSGLETIATFDVLSHFDLHGKGYEGYGGVWVEAPENAEFQVGNVTFRLGKGYGRVEWEDKDGQSGTIYIQVEYAPISLYNGSVVKAKIDVPADVFLLDGVMLTGVEREYTVECMQESMEVDFLPYYDFYFYGQNGYGNMDIIPKQEKATFGDWEVDLATGAWSKNGEIWCYTQIYAEECSLLHNGQTFYVYVNFPADVFSGMGVILINNRIEITASGLTE